MNWDAIGAIGEIVGAMAVLMTLIVLIVQVRHGARAVDEANNLERAAAIDRHSDTIARWRGRLTESSELTDIWIRAFRGDSLTETDLSRVNFLWIELVNTQRANYGRAMSVGAPGLADQAVLVVAANAASSRTFDLLWESVRAWASLTSPEYVELVDAELERMKEEGIGDFDPLPLIDRLQPDGTIK